MGNGVIGKDLSQEEGAKLKACEGIGGQGVRSNLRCVGIGLVTSREVHIGAKGNNCDIGIIEGDDFPLKESEGEGGPFVGDSDVLRPQALHAMIKAIGA